MEKAEAELKKLKLMSPMSAEATVVRNYLTLTGLPWRKKSKVNNDLRKPIDVLEADHYGLEKVKGTHSRIPRSATARGQG
jgi:ATP-dependent Lon protease